MNEELKAIAFALAVVLAKEAKHNLSYASMIAVDFNEALRHTNMPEIVRVEFSMQFFNLFEKLKTEKL